MAHQCKRDCDCDFKVALRKRTTAIAKLIKQIYGNKIQRMFRYTNTGAIFMQINKHQLISLDFAFFDTWDKIKSKVEKLLKSDGICVVCMEKEKGKKANRPCCNDKHCTEQTVVDTVSYICGGCCEFLCLSCYQKMNNHKCPVCRQCIETYVHKFKQEECKCDEPDPDQVLRDEMFEQMLALSDEDESSSDESEDESEDESDAASP